jgi:hypothetical protein
MPELNENFAKKIADRKEDERGPKREKVYPV